MKYELEWMGSRVGEDLWFPARVPGNIQHDYGCFKGFADIHYGENVAVYEQFEDDTWLYQTRFCVQPRDGERLYFVSDGIDYRFEVWLDGERLLEHEGMFSRIEVDLTEKLKAEGNCLEVRVLPHPSGGQARGTGREEAARSCKPAVGYGWDWHPRLLSSGMWQEAWLETRDAGFIRDCEARYSLNDALDTAAVTFQISCDAPVTIQVFDREGGLIHEGTEPNFILKNIKLWWCSGQGEPYLYQYCVKSATHERRGHIGFRTIQLVMNEGSWEKPEAFPKTRSTPPATICLNGRRIFAKGSNLVRPELFPGTVTAETWRTLVELAKGANMNLFRCWGGAEINKEAFYELCDQYGIMVWQEFPLACNAYPNDSGYLRVLEQEAAAVIRRLRRHPSLVLWCGGNELFNAWSGMTDQDLPLRLLNRLCYELDRDTPFIMTSPLMGMAHGGYLFRDYDTGEDVFETFQHSRNTAYTEFGVPGMPDPAYLEAVIPSDELFPVREDGAWKKHHGAGAWRRESWVHQDILEHYFGEAKSLAALCSSSQWLQCAGYQAIFEEARRQWPACAMAANWCFNEPWKTAANNSLLSYPCVPKPAYEAVRAALRPVMPSARIPKFSWQEGEMFGAELWLLNDSPEEVRDIVTAYLVLDGTATEVMRWDTGACGPNSHKQGHKLQWKLPRLASGHVILRLESAHGNSEYKLLYRARAQKAQKKLLNQ